ncbi:MAG: hypothetical protein IKJ67_07200 [Bacteroidales bacterium]|nr:hypothetical protein [Bacteroidales bacterium]
MLATIISEHSENLIRTLQKLTKAFAKPVAPDLLRPTHNLFAEQSQEMLYHIMVSFPI